MPQNHPLDGARWIAAAKECQSPVIKRRITCGKPLSASISITGLGYFTAWLNGRPISDHRFQPVASEYGPRDLSVLSYPLYDQMTYRIYYCTYDVTALVEDGENLLTIQLGNGFYRQTERVSEGNAPYGDTLKTIYCLTVRYADREARFCSDGSETWQESRIVCNNLYVGEVHDLGMVPGAERPVAVLPDEPGILSPQIGTPDREIRTLSPKLLSEKAGVRIYDAGENISGLVRLRVDGDPGQRVTLRFAENLTAEGELDFESTGSHYTCTSGVPQIQTDVCVCGGKEAVFAPMFCWHAFRYFSLEGPGYDPEVAVIHADAPLTASFDSDSEALNFLFDAFVRTQHNNMHGSYPSDCPHRERLGYTGDGQVTAAATMMLLESKEFYRKWMQDILDTQDTVSGHTQHTAPLGGGGGGPVGWGGAIVVVPYRYFKQYGDTELLEKSWEPIHKWLGYIQTRMDDFLVMREEEKGWCLGDWATPGPVLIPEPFVNTCLLIRFLDMLLETAPLIGRQGDMAELEALRENCRRAVRDMYFDDKTGSFCDGVRGADAYGLYAGLGDERTVQRLFDKYDALGTFDTGFIGTDVLLEILFRHGGEELAYKLLSSEKCGSFLYMKRHGATTLWEYWDGQQSQDHPMFGGCLRHVFEGFLGIRQAYGTGGYSKVSVEPRLPEALRYMKGTLSTPRGALSVSLCREGKTVAREINLPYGD